MDVGPARQPRSPLVFRVGTEPHFPCLERLPTGYISRCAYAPLKVCFQLPVSRILGNRLYCPPPTERHIHVLKTILNSDTKNSRKHCLIHCFQTLFMFPPSQEAWVHY